MNDKPYLHWGNQHDVERAALLLGQGKVIVGSSDTVLGLLSAISEQGYQNLNSIKRRTDKPYLILLDSPSTLATYASMPLQGWVTKLIQQYWPGPLTIIIKAREGLADWMQAFDGTVAVRVPDHDGIRALAARIGPLFSTSANLSGESVPDCFQDIRSVLTNRVAAFIDDSKQPSLQPSTIVDCTGDFPIIIREGAIPSTEIMAIE